MELLKQILIESTPVIILGFVLIYLFHEGVRYLKARDAQQLKQPRHTAAAAPTVVGNSGPSDALLKLELQAAERFALYLERIAPDRLVMRVHRTGMDAKMLQSEILRSIREEFDHNLSQQIYISPESWDLIKKAKDEMVKFITACGEGLNKDATALDLSRVIFDGASKVERLPGEVALQFLRSEIRATIHG